MARPCGVVLDISPQSHNEVINRPRIGAFLQAPSFVEHHLPGNRLSLMLDQVAKDMGLHPREPTDLAVDSEFQTIEMDHLIGFIAEREDLLRLLRRYRS